MMLGLVLLALATAGIIQMARTRGGSPWRYGLLAALRWLVTGTIAGAVVDGLGLLSGGMRLLGTLIYTVVPCGRLSVSSRSTSGTS